MGKSEPRSLDSMLVLKKFNTWLEENRDKFDEFDHSFGVTSYDYDRNTDGDRILGKAYIGGICQKL